MLDKDLEDEIKSLIGREIRSLRINKGWSIEYLAGESKLNTDSVGDAERGATMISLQSLVKISAALGIKTTHFSKLIDDNILPELKEDKE
ncbi:helix-turn-helix domain-containing protein [Evansella clarkii]|uniref:helix-turn-helix domain-containing protein n=1 Tax=Evansella clarkii TaxID=79879 RepID=UPI000B431485|nr:helix-turn-helix transcriptional regulator [Evansella clarkii]